MDTDPSHQAGHFRPSAQVSTKAGAFHIRCQLGVVGGASSYVAQELEEDNISYCSLVVATLTGAVSGAKGTALANEVKSAGQLGELLAGSLGGVLPAAVVEPFTWRSGC